MDTASHLMQLQGLLTETNLQLVKSPAWYARLKAEINALIDKDFSSLVGLLYQVDISEEKLRRLLHQQPATDAADIIAGLLIERQLQKIKFRNQFNTPPPADDDMEERW